MGTKINIQKYKPRSWWHYVLILIALLFTLLFTARWWNPIVFPPVSNPVIGVSFSEKRAKEMNLDWQANYLALLDDLNIRHFRLMSYWDIHEPVQGQYDFSSLDWQVSEASKRGAKISMAIGLRQPRWPECHQPDWSPKLRGDAWNTALYTYIETVVKRYEKESAVISWQLENEGVNEWFGECGKPDPKRLVEEYKLVDNISSKPIWMSLSDQHGLPINPPVPDKFGYSVYRVVWSEKTWPYRGYLVYPTPIWYHKLRAVAIKAISGRDIFIHELQLEPWGPKDTTELTKAEQDISMSPAQIKDNLFFAREIGAKDIYTWGGEWWYWRLQQGDPSVWNTVKYEFENSQQQ